MEVGEIATMNGRDYTIKLNSFELGVLTRVIMQLDDRNQRALRGVWEQLIELKRQFEQEAGVKKEMLPSGMLKITLNSFKLGLLTGVMMKLDDRDQLALRGVWEQLVELKRQVEKEVGVKKEVLPGGMLKITDKDGNVIIREPYPFETEGN